MIRKLIAIICAVLINCAVLAWFNAAGARAVASATPAGSKTATVTLPAITVKPTRAQLKLLRGEAGARRMDGGAVHAAPVADGDAQTLVTPFHPFADEPAAADAG